jgi:16S rRNA (guanine527-N7)-methyltransferase
MTPDRICALLTPFLSDERLSTRQLALVSEHLDLLLKWNSKMNLTAVRDPEKIVTRHFGESFFAARQLFPEVGVPGAIIDLGSGAGFPGIPIKIWSPALTLTAIESQHKKAVFLREAMRALRFSAADVVCDRAEAVGRRADTVTLRAVECFASVVLSAARLLTEGGRLALLVGEGQVSPATSLLPDLVWDEPLRVPLSRARVLLVGRAPSSQSDIIASKWTNAG